MLLSRLPQLHRAALLAIGLLAAACGQQATTGDASGTTPDPTPADGRQRSDRGSGAFVGLTLDEAGLLADGQHRPWRVVHEDSQDLAITDDFAEDRLNFTVVDGVVTVARTDGELVEPDVNCDRMIHDGALPTWATDANITSAKFVVADDDRVLGVLWADPLVAGEASPDRPNNKILWVVNGPRDGSALQVTATPHGRPEPVVEYSFPANSGPGEIYPSIVDVPEPGCWEMRLEWAGNETTVLVPYEEAQR